MRLTGSSDRPGGRLHRSSMPYDPGVGCLSVGAHSPLGLTAKLRHAARPMSETAERVRSARASL